MAHPGPSSDLDRDVELCAAAHQRLLARLDGLLDSATLDPEAPSRLPGWSRGHLLTHLARNADSHRRILDAAADGRVADQYPGGVEQREAEIEAGAGRGAGELVDDVRRTVWALETAWARSDWTGDGRQGGDALVPVADLPFRRLREVEVHHYDLDVGHELDDLDPTYVRLELRRMEMAWRARQPMGLTPLPDLAQAAPPPRRLGWLLGRVEIEGLGPAHVF